MRANSHRHQPPSDGWGRITLGSHNFGLFRSSISQHSLVSFTLPFPPPPSCDPLLSDQTTTVNMMTTSRGKEMTTSSRDFKKKIVSPDVLLAVTKFMESHHPARSRPVDRARVEGHLIYVSKWFLKVDSSSLLRFPCSGENDVS